MTLTEEYPNAVVSRGDVGQPNGVAPVGPDGFIPPAFLRLPFVDVGSYAGADPTGATSSRDAILAALADLAPGGTLSFGTGTYAWTGDIVLTTPGITITNSGNLLGTFKVGSGAAKFEAGIVFNVRMVRPSDPTAYGSMWAADSALIKIDRARDVLITQSELGGAARMIDCLPNDLSGQHDISMIRVVSNRIREHDYVVYGDYSTTALAGWQACADFTVVANQVNRSYVAMFHMTGLDGAVIVGNTAFETNYANAGAMPRKEHNIYVGRSNWMIIVANDLFEAGLESICLLSTQVATVVGNNIAWPGQRVPSSGIKITRTDSEFGVVIVTGNTIHRYTKDAVELVGAFASIRLSNASVYKEDSAFYKGTTPLSSIPHYRNNCSGVTNLIAGEIGIEDPFSSQPGQSDLLPGMANTKHAKRRSTWSAESDSERVVTVTAGQTYQTAATLRNANNAQSGELGGLVVVTVKSGTENASKVSVYTIQVWKGSGDSQAQQFGKGLGYVAGALADDPSFEFDMSGNLLRLKPIGLTAGTFTVTVTALGDLTTS